MKPLFVLGSGGQARDVAEVAAALDFRPVFVAPDVEAMECFDGDDEIVLEEEAVAHPTESFAIGVGNNHLRARLAARWQAQLQFPSLIHPDTTLARGMTAMIGQGRGTILFPGVRIMGRCRIGNFCTLNLGATVSHDCRIADFANLSPGTHIAGNVHVGEGAWLGMGVVVNQGADDAPRTIGEWSTVGSGAAVLRDVPANHTQVGVPAKEINS